jgi:hypothetical protein
MENTILLQDVEAALAINGITRELYEEKRAKAVTERVDFDEFLERAAEAALDNFEATIDGAIDELNTF